MTIEYEVIVIPEEWLPIEGFDGYEVSNMGRVRSYKRDPNGYILSLRITPSGYAQVHLTSNNNKRYSLQVHRLVLKTFNPTDNMDNLEVNHLDENKKNNCVENLSWTTRVENMNYGTVAQRISEKNKKLVRCIETNDIYGSLTDASKSTGINIGNISSCCHEKLKSAGGYHWEYINKTVPTTA